MFLNGTASGKRVVTHMIVSKKYWLPDLVFGNGPTQSISTLPKGSSTAGMGGVRRMLIGVTHHLASVTYLTEIRHIFV